ncbi:MAG: isochorismatase family protein [Alphaproteobacteria bacterium]|nr:isochorismatase family protein [Alphaproteobacteria bacterium]
MHETLTLRAQRLVDVADIIQVPVLIGCFPGEAETDCLAEAFPNSPSPGFPFHPKPETWATTEFGQAIAAVSRNQVVIAGFWLEEAVTLLALNCLAVGYDTYVAGDATPAVDCALEPAARARLTQAGVVPTSIDQVIREWAALHDNPAHAVKLIAGLPQRVQSSP